MADSKKEPLLNEKEIGIPDEQDGGPSTNDGKQFIFNTTGLSSAKAK